MERIRTSVAAGTLTTAATRPPAWRYVSNTTNAARAAASAVCPDGKDNDHAGADGDQADDGIWRWTISLAASAISPASAGPAAQSATTNQSRRVHAKMSTAPAAVN